MIPDFDESGNLPPGIHDATWDEVVERYGGNRRRERLLQGLKRALDDLRAAGCQTVYLDGSFVTQKELPGDFDACWVPDGVSSDDLHPSLLKLTIPRSAQKRRYGGELVIADGLSEPFGPRYLQFFQQDARTGQVKGIIKVDLKELP